MASLPRSARLLRALVVVTCLVPAVQACGGRSDTEDYLFGADGTITTGARSSTGGRGSTIGGTRSAGGASATGGRSGTAGTSASSFGGTVTAGGGGPIPHGGSSATGGTGIVGGATSVGGTISMGGVSTAGAGGGVAVRPIVCGGQLCDPATQSCCAGLSGLSCIGNGQACDGAVLGCTVNADCEGNGICCISITGDISAASSCKARCDIGSTRDRQLCQTDDECVAPTHYCTPTIFGVNICTRRP